MAGDETEPETMDVEGDPSDSEGSKMIDTVRAVSEAYDADIYVYSAGIDHIGFGKLIGSFPESPRKNGLLIMTTSGGTANAAYQIARFMQNSYERFLLFIPAFCKSAGTLVAVGANRLIMTPFSELGPLDVQLYERDEIGARKSGLLTNSAFEALREETFALYEHFLLHIKMRSSDNISFPLASEVAGDLAAQMMATIYAQISPNILGSDHRDLKVATEYGRRLAAVSQNIDTSAIMILTEGYPSHDFIIDQQEASQLFTNVESPEPSLFELISHLSEFVFIEREEGFVVCLTSLLSQENDDETDVQEEPGDESVAVEDRPKGDLRRPQKARARGSRQSVKREA